MTLKELAELNQQHLTSNHPNFPSRYVPRARYSDKTANGLTRAIIDYIRLTGHQAERVSNMGRYQEGKTVIDVIGRARVSKGKWIPGSGRRGTADIAATKRIEVAGRKVGMKVAIEVKIGGDKQSEAQKEYQAEVERAGGVYIIVRTFNDFIKQWHEVK